MVPDPTASGVAVGSLTGFFENVLCIHAFPGKGLIFYDENSLFEEFGIGGLYQNYLTGNAFDHEAHNLSALCGLL